MSDQYKKCEEVGNCFEFMPDSDGKHSQAELSSLFLKHPIRETVTFFGGSFNPFHEGHRACLDLCPEKNIVVVPDRNPFKEQLDKNNVYDDFVSLAELLKDTCYSIYPGFLAKKCANPTSSWLPFVKMKEVNILLGDDSFMNLLSWKDPEIIVRALSKLYVVPREFSKSDYVLVEKELLKINPKLEVHYLAEHPYMNISSSNCRNS